MSEDSYPLFNLPVPSSRDVTFENINKPPYILATVVDKHFCMVKRDGTRYRVPNGTKFFRVRVKLLSAHNSKNPKIDMDKINKELDGMCGKSMWNFGHLVKNCVCNRFFLYAFFVYFQHKNQIFVVR